MKQLTITDMTLRLFSQNDTLSFRDKIEIARLLDKLGVSAVETPALTDAHSDRLLIKSIVAAVQNAAVCLPVGLSQESIAQAWEVVREAARCRAPGAAGG